MKIIDQIPSKYTESIVMSLLTLLSLALSTSAHELIIVPLLQAGKNDRIALITSASFGLFLFFLSYSVYLRFIKNKPKADKYNTNEFTGISSHKKTGKLYCTSCLVKNIESPLKTLEYGWICLNKDCRYHFNDPKNPTPEPQRKTFSKGVEPWVTRW